MPYVRSDTVTVTTMSVYLDFSVPTTVYIGDDICFSGILQSYDGTNWYAEPNRSVNVVWSDTTGPIIFHSAAATCTDGTFTLWRSAVDPVTIGTNYFWSESSW